MPGDCYPAKFDLVVGKACRGKTAIDPAPISMFEIRSTNKSEYATECKDGNRLRYKTNEGMVSMKFEVGRI